ncbi:unnamed protein product [Symbiodinium sp. CCMP2592]|nr:unnamed protein product [Symbiodinium sp. CCMP2592]
MTPPCRRGQPRVGALCLLCLLLGAALPASAPPLWWRKGRPREKLGSRAEAELLCQLAVLLMPDVPIAEGFRDFPVKKCKQWGSSRLSPDLTAYGVLKATDAALFIEYDGHYRHIEPPGLARDTRKTSALLKFAPAGSVVVRIAHKERRWKDKSMQVLVDSWCAEHEPSLLKALNQVVASLSEQSRGRLHPTVASRLEAFAAEEGINEDASTRARKSELVGRSNSSRPNLEEFLCEEVGLHTRHVARVIATFPRLLGYSIEANLKPTVEWIKALGLSQSQVAKVILGHPQVLGYSIEANLKPTVEWIKALGLSQSQVAKVILGHPQVAKVIAMFPPVLGLSIEVAKVIATFPSVLGYSIEANLKPTVEWIKGLGLSQSQVAKVILGHPQVAKVIAMFPPVLGLSIEVAKVIATFPSVLGYSIEANLKPTVEWIKGLGLSQSQVAKVILGHPQVLGYSIEANLKPTVEWIKGLGLSQSQVAKVIATSPQLLGLSIEANLKPSVEWIKGLGLSQSQVAKVIATFPSVLGLSIEGNLKPTVEWIKGLGLGQSQVAKVIAKCPSVLSLSIEANLKPTVGWIEGLGLSQSQVSKVIATCPPVLGYSIEANLKPTVEWIKGLGLSQPQVAKVIAIFPTVLGYSIEANLKPTVEWIKGLGLSQSQVAKVIAIFPAVLGCSIEENLKLTVEWIKGLGLSQSQVAKVILQRPQVLGLSIEANLKPSVEWIKGLGLSQSQVAKVIAKFPPVLGLSIDANLSEKHLLLQQYFPGVQAAKVLAQGQTALSLASNKKVISILQEAPKAEVELLSQLAVLLMPDAPISEAFRDFPVKKCTEWGSSRLCPDLTAYGVLKAANAALFVEYDGHYRHMEPSGLATDIRKTSALLKFAPAGSVVLRIAHKERQWKDKSVQVLVDCWQSEHLPSLRRTVQQVVASLLPLCRDELVSGLVSQLARAPPQIDRHAQAFAVDAELVGSASSSNRLAVQEFLQKEMQLTPVQVAKLIDSFPSVLGCNVEANLKPTVEWVKGLGLSQSQVATLILRHPQLLGLSIEVAKVILGRPQTLGYSLEANLKPTVEWIKGLGLSQSQVAKVILRRPQVLGLSIEANLKPSVEWIKGLGLSQSQIARVIATFPPVLGLSIEANLKPKVGWFKWLGLSQSQVAKVIATFPQVLGLSIEANLMLKYVLIQNFFPGAAATELLARLPSAFQVGQRHGFGVRCLQPQIPKFAGAKIEVALLPAEPTTSSAASPKRKPAAKGKAKAKPFATTFATASLSNQISMFSDYAGLSPERRPASAPKGNMRSPCRRGQRQPRVSALRLLCLLLGAALPASVPPPWWRKGRPREKLGSRAEAELLCQLAVLLMPDVPFAEAFRDFPVKKCKQWGSSRLSPDLTAYGVLKATDAALFIEYDGHYRHMEPPGLARDMRKTSALLEFAPAGSVVVRIAHKERQWKDKSTQVVVDSWFSEHEPSLLKALNQVAASLLHQSRGRLHPTLVSRLESFAAEEGINDDASTRAKEVDLVGMSDSSRPNLEEFLRKEVGLSTWQVAEVIAKCPQVLGYSIEANLKPTVEWIKGLGMSQSQVAKVIAAFPAVLGLSIEANLKPTVEWMKGLGLSQSQVAKIIATFPQVLGLSSEENLKPTVDWINSLGLSQSQVAKVIVKHPQVLGLSIEANLKPTVDWVKGLGLSQSQVAKIIATFPQVLGYSIEANLKPTVEWIKGLGMSQSQVAKVILRHPQVLGLSIEANLKPSVEWIKGLGLSQSQVAKVIARFPSVLGYSIEANQKPTVKWIKGLGLSQSQVAKVIVKHPPVLGYSLQANLKPTVEWIKGLGLSPSQVAKVIAAFPAVLGYSIEANLKPTVEWMKGLGLSQSQVAKVIPNFPQVLSLSIDMNLSMKHLLLQRYFPGVQAAKLLAQTPRLWSYRYARLEHRLAVLKAQGQLSKLASAMTLPLDVFTRRRFQADPLLLKELDMGASPLHLAAQLGKPELVSLLLELEGQTALSLASNKKVISILQEAPKPGMLQIERQETRACRLHQHLYA